MERIRRYRTIEQPSKRSFMSFWGMYIVYGIMMVVMIACAVRMILLQNEVDTLKERLGTKNDSEINAYEEGRYDYSYNPARVRYEEYFSNIYDDKTSITVFKDEYYDEVSIEDKIEAGEELIYELDRYYNFVGFIDLEISDNMGDIVGIDHPYDIDMTNFYNFSYYLIDEENRKYTIVVNKQALECENPWVYLYSVVHGFLHLYYHELVSANDHALYEMTGNQVSLRDNQKLNLMAEELNAYEGKPEDIEKWLRSNTPFTYTEAIIMDESIVFINNNRRLLLGDDK